MISAEKLKYLEERRRGIGGSDIAAIMGLSPWKSPFQVYQEKRGEVPHWEGNEQTDWGLRLEPALRQWYADTTGRAVRVPEEANKIAKHSDYPFIMASLDGYTDCKRIVELKTARYAKGWGEPGTAEVPDGYSMQVQWYMAVTGYPVADVVVSIGGAPACMYEVPEDKEIQNLMIEAAREFWAKVQAGEAPEPISYIDAVAKFGFSNAAGVVLASAEVANAAIELKKVRDQIKELEAKDEDLKFKLIVALGEKGDTLVTPDGKTLCTYKISKGRKTLDAKALEAEEPIIYSKYVKTGVPSRRFLLK